VKTLKTEITINASPQTVWSIMDNLNAYPEWNQLVPELQGRTTVDSVVNGKLVQPNMPVIPLAPTITRIVGARELRWISVVPGDEGFSAEHYFILTPTKDGGTHLIHNEDFDGPGVEMMWEGIDSNSRAAYNQMNEALKERAEHMENAQSSIHPAVDKGLSSSKGEFAGATLKCACKNDTVEVKVTYPASHNHLCGCSKCWKPEGALFAQTAVVPRGTLEVIANGDKLSSVDPSQAIERYACKECGVHMCGRVEDKDHHFYGLEFIHPELSDDQGWQVPEFAGFVSSIIEAGANPSEMGAVRRRLSQLGIDTYDAFSPELMDIIAWHKVKLA
jgi:S-(hydroxymethyl)glutathione synthase